MATSTTATKEIATLHKSSQYTFKKIDHKKLIEFIVFQKQKILPVIKKNLVFGYNFFIT